MSTSSMALPRLDTTRTTITSTRLVDDVTWELRMALGYTIRDARRRLTDMTLSERSDRAVSVLRTRTRVAGLDPYLIGDVGVDAFNKGVRISTPAFEIGEDLMLLPELGQMGIRNCFDSLNGVPLYGGISARRLARGIVDRTWREGDETDSVMDFVTQLVLIPMDNMRHQMVQMISA